MRKLKVVEYIKTVVSWGKSCDPADYRAAKWAHYIHIWGCSDVAMERRVDGSGDLKLGRECLGVSV